LNAKKYFGDSDELFEEKKKWNLLITLRYRDGQKRNVAEN
jgi:hypothetical protein